MFYVISVVHSGLFQKRRVEIVRVIGPFQSGSMRASFRRRFEALKRAERERRKQAQITARQNGFPVVELSDGGMSGAYSNVCPHDWKPILPEEFEWSKFFKI